MNTYQVHSIIKGHAVETVQAPHSFAARKGYAARHDIGLTDCYAKRVWEPDGFRPPVHDSFTIR